MRGNRNLPLVITGTVILLATALIAGWLLIDAYVLRRGEPTMVPYPTVEATEAPTQQPGEPETTAAPPPHPPSSEAAPAPSDDAEPFVEDSFPISDAIDFAEANGFTCHDEQHPDITSITCFSANLPVRFYAGGTLDGELKHLGLATGFGDFPASEFDEMWPGLGKLIMPADAWDVDTIAASITEQDKPDKPYITMGGRWVYAASSGIRIVTSGWLEQFEGLSLPAPMTETVEAWEYLGFDCVKTEDNSYATCEMYFQDFAYRAFAQPDGTGRVVTWVPSGESLPPAQLEFLRTAAEPLAQYDVGLTRAIQASEVGDAMFIGHVWLRSMRYTVPDSDLVEIRLDTACWGSNVRTC